MQVWILNVLGYQLGFSQQAVAIWFAGKESKLIRLRSDCDQGHYNDDMMIIFMIINGVWNYQSTSSFVLSEHDTETHGYVTE